VTRQLTANRAQAEDLRPPPARACISLPNRFSAVAEPPVFFSFERASPASRARRSRSFSSSDAEIANLHGVEAARPASPGLSSQYPARISVVVSLETPLPPGAEVPTNTQPNARCRSACHTPCPRLLRAHVCRCAQDHPCIVAATPGGVGDEFEGSSFAVVAANSHRQTDVQHLQLAFRRNRLLEGFSSR